MLDPITQDEAEALFFKAMQFGYASGAEPQRDRPHLGWKLLEYKKKDLYLIDMWHTTPRSYYSSGVTTISHNGVVVWVMHYGGWYAEEAIPTLKAALHFAYSQNMFRGGRGPKFFQNGQYTYRNKPNSMRFVCFSGQEEVYDSSGTQLGNHWYHGQWMLD